MTYQYQSLHHDDAIRLLKLHPAAKAEDQIRCDLEEHMLCDISAYEAVSYVWGTSAGHTSVLCVDKDFRVTHNLAAALRRFRTSDENRYLWVDAICINQNDISERNEQVKMMQKIYQNASRVLVWLGAADMAVHAAVQLIDQMFIVACRYWGFDSNETVHFDDVDDFVDFPSTPAIPPSGSDEWQPLIDFFSREWFQRTWIVQEVTAARVVTAFCGNYELSWQRIGVAASWVQKQITKGDFNHFSEFENSNVYKAMVLYDKPYLQQQDFLDLLAQLRDFAATDKKDKVYALLGLEPFSTLPRSIQIDYNKSKVEVYKDVVEVSLKYHKDLSILSFIHHSSAIDETWPTFVPPWDTAPTAANLLGQSPGFESYASGEVKLDAFGYKLTDTSLTLYGLSLGSINIVGELMSADHFRGMSDHFEHDKHPVQRFWKHHLNAFQDYRKVPSVDLLVIRLCLTMTAAQNSNYEKVDRTSDDGRNHIDGHLADYAAYIQNFDSESAALRLIVQDLNEEDDYTGDPTKFEIAASRVCDDRRLFLFGDEFIGLGPNVLQAEDQLCILFGGQHLYILRPRGGCHQLVGECFVQGLMWGEGSEAYRDGQQQVQQFCLV